MEASSFLSSLGLPKLSSSSSPQPPPTAEVEAQNQDDQSEVLEIASYVPSVEAGVATGVESAQLGLGEEEEEEA